jgi:DNA-binding transcriptional LysR family regulator
MGFGGFGMGLSSHQLHIFYTVAEKGSFSAAAASLHMTQPAVTMQVQSLEEYFGTKLFVRSTKKVELTEAGKTLLPYARRSIELIMETEAAMAKFTQKLEGRLHLGASMTIGEYILPRILGPFSREYPNIHVSVKVINTSQIVEELISHQLTFGLVEAPVSHPELRSEAVMEDELMLILPDGHPLLQWEEVPLDEALRYPFVLREQGSGTRQVMEEELQARGISPLRMDIVMELGSTGAVKSAVEAGLGLSILSPTSVKHEARLGVLHTRRIAGVRFKRQFYTIYVGSTILPISAVTFLSFLRDRDLTQWLL